MYFTKLFSLSFYFSDFMCSAYGNLIDESWWSRAFYWLALTQNASLVLLTLSFLPVYYFKVNVTLHVILMVTLFVQAAGNKFVSQKVKELYRGFQFIQQVHLFV